jgi:hypothetical protein
MSASWDRPQHAANQPSARASFPDPPAGSHQVRQRVAADVSGECLEDVRNDQRKSVQHHMLTALVKQLARQAVEELHQQ